MGENMAMMVHGMATPIRYKGGEEYLTMDDVFPSFLSKKVRKLIATSIKDEIRTIARFIESDDETVADHIFTDVTQTRACKIEGELPYNADRGIHARSTLHLKDASSGYRMRVFLYNTIYVFDDRDEHHFEHCDHTVNIYLSEKSYCRASFDGGTKEGSILNLSGMFEMTSRIFPNAKWEFEPYSHLQELSIESEKDSEE